MATIPQSLFELLTEELRRNGNNLSRASRVLDVPYPVVKQLQQPETYHRGFTPARGPEPSRPEEMAKPGWEPFAVAVKRAGCAWPEKYSFILYQARKAFDNGTHMMFQTTTDGWVVQYLYPRKYPVKPARFFF